MMADHTVIVTIVITTTPLPVYDMDIFNVIILLLPHPPSCSTTTLGPSLDHNMHCSPPRG